MLSSTNIICQCAVAFPNHPLNTTSFVRQCVMCMETNKQITIINYNKMKKRKDESNLPAFYAYRFSLSVITRHVFNHDPGIKKKINVYLYSVACACTRFSRRLTAHGKLAKRMNVTHCFLSVSWITIAVQSSSQYVFKSSLWGHWKGLRTTILRAIWRPVPEAFASRHV